MAAAVAAQELRSPPSDVITNDDRSVSSLADEIFRYNDPLLLKSVTRFSFKCDREFPVRSVLGVIMETTPDSCVFPPAAAPQSKFVFPLAPLATDSAALSTAGGHLQGFRTGTRNGTGAV